MPRAWLRVRKLASARAGMMSVGRDVLHGALKIGQRDRGILRRHFLIRPVIDAVARELLPVARPVAAEPAIAVIDQQRPATGSRRFNSIGGLISGYLLHDFDCKWRRPHASAYAILG